jgi:hypothetical protein
MPDTASPQVCSLRRLEVAVVFSVRTLLPNMSLFRFERVVVPHRISLFRFERAVTCTNRLYPRVAPHAGLDLR